jgi:Transglutaminase-like superfamily
MSLRAKMRTSDDLAQAARRAGLTLEQTERVAMPGGGSTLAARLTFDDPWAAARFLTVLADQDASDPVVRSWALEMLKAATQENGQAMSGPEMGPPLRELFARTIHANVQRQIRFVHEPRETFQSARATMQLGAGDCDDHARLVHALGRAGGLKSRLAFFEEDAQPVHVVSRLGAARGYTWAETTIPAKFGEHPKVAYRRLRAAGELVRDELDD